MLNFLLGADIIFDSIYHEKNMNSDTALMTIPMVNPGNGLGFLKRKMATQRIATMEMSKTMALKSEMRMGDFFKAVSLFFHWLLPC